MRVGGGSVRVGDGWLVTKSATVGDGVAMGAAAGAHAAMLRQAAVKRIERRARQLCPRVGSSWREGREVERIEMEIRQPHSGAGGSWADMPEPEVIEMYGEIGGLGGVGKETGHT